MLKDLPHLETLLTQAWEARDTLSPRTTGEIQDAVRLILGALDEGDLRVAEKIDGHWHTHQWIKMAILLSFRLRDNFFLADHHNPSFDKVPLKFEEWDEDQFREAGIRVVPGAIVRHSAFIDRGVVLMPSFVNVGARIGEGTLIDGGARVGSCAQVGKNCHISGGVGLGGVLEPLQANPVIVEDNCFIGANSEVAEGAMIGEGAVLSAGVFITASTKIVNRETGEISHGFVPPYGVVVPGTLPPKEGNGPHLQCAVIVKQVDAQTRSKVSINELLR